MAANSSRYQQVLGSASPSFWKNFLPFIAAMAMPFF
jgi:hypothetical protein